MTVVNRVLTSGDFATLSDLFEEWQAAGDALVPTARKILEGVVVVFPSDLPPDVANLGSTLQYSDSSGKRRVVELTALSRQDGDSLPIHHPLGLALLGRREGDEIDVRLDDGTLQRIRLEKVLAQSERSRHGADTSHTDRNLVIARTEGEA